MEVPVCSAVDVVEVVAAAVVAVREARLQVTHKS